MRQPGCTDSIRQILADGQPRVLHQIRNAQAKKWDGQEVQAALAKLVKGGLVKRSQGVDPRGVRPEVHWYSMAAHQVIDASQTSHPQELARQAPPA